MFPSRPTIVALGSALALGLAVTPAPAQQSFVLEVESVTISPAGLGVVGVLITNDANLAGWSYGVCHETDVATILDVVAGQAIMGPDEPDFHSVFVCDPCGGFSVGTVYFGAGITFLPVGVAQEVDVATYAADVPAPASTPLSVCGTIGTPPTPVVFVVHSTGESIDPDIVDGVLIVDESFRRGDINGDGDIGLADAIQELNALFVPGPALLPCSDAADVNDDGALGLADPITILGVLFLGDPPPPPPFSDCGFDDTDDGLDCVILPVCP